jgi:hypothetical protein
MKWLLTLESFTSKLPKKYFVKYDNNLKGMIGPDTSLNHKLINMLIDTLFDEVIILEDMSMKEIKGWIDSIKEGDKVFSYSSLPLDVKDVKYDKLLYMRERLNKKGGIDFWMNDNFTKSKTDYYNLLKNCDFMPKTYFSKEDAIKNLEFPIVAKPDGGSLGFGIEKFDTKEELESSTLKFDLYCEYVEHIHEFRAFVLDGKVIYIIERIAKYKDKKNIDTKAANEIIDFVYIPQELKGFPYLRKINNVIEVLDKKLGSHVKSIYTVDLFITPQKEVKVIESNSKSQLGPYTFAEVCKNLFDIRYDTTLLLEEIKNLYLHNSYEEHKKQIEKSLHPVSYDTKPISDGLLSAVEKYKVKTISGLY